MMKCENCAKLNSKKILKNYSQFNKCSACNQTAISKKVKLMKTPSQMYQSDLEMCLHEIIDLKHKLDECREVKLKTSLTKLTSLRDEINNKANEIISAIQKKQMKLLTETKTIELYLRKKYNTNSVDLEIEKKTKECKQYLEKNEKELNDQLIDKLMDDLLKLKPNLDERIFQIEKINDDDFEFVSKISTETDTCDFGEIIGKKSGVSKFIFLY
jgi:hypothetical protein